MTQDKIVTKEGKVEDLRPMDIEKMNEYGLHRAWVDNWEGPDGIYQELDRSLNPSQNLWHVSRLSFLRGYLYAMELKKSR